MKGKPVLFAAAAFSLFTLAVRPGKLFMVNVTPSSPRGLYLVSRKPASPGDFVVVNSDNLLFNNGIKNARFLKKVAFAGNERVVINRESLVVDGKAVYRKSRDAGIFYDGVLENGEAIILGTHERSFDSRYFGPVSLAACTRVVPLFLIDRYEKKQF